MLIVRSRDGGADSHVTKAAPVAAVRLRVVGGGADLLELDVYGRVPWALSTG